MKLTKNTQNNNYFVLSIDTECDKDPKWVNSSPLSFEGITKGIPQKLQPLFEQYGIIPTYFLSPEVLENKECCEILSQIKECELATHMHGDFIEPDKTHQDFSGKLCNNMQNEYSYELEYQKMLNLTNLFKEKFGYAPFSFRAGRYGIGYNSGKILLELGYKIDSSVTPHLAWKNRAGGYFPDFRKLGEKPYFISSNGNIWNKGDSDLLEVPLTIRKKFFKQIWLRPWYTSSKKMISIIKDELKKPDNEPKVLVMMFHNMEIIPAASPYPQTKQDVDFYLDELKKVFEFVNMNNIKPVALKDTYSLFKKS